MQHEIYWMTLTIIMTAVIWVPYIINRMIEMGVWQAIANANMDPTPTATWAKRMMCAHRNAVENLVIFAPLVIALAALDVSTSLTVAAAKFYFFARLAHLVVYTFGVPVVRTLMFVVGFACQVLLAWALLGAL